MKHSTALVTAGLIALFAWDAAFAQSPSQTSSAAVTEQ